MRSVNIPGDPAFDRFAIDGAREHNGVLMLSGQLGATNGGMREQIVASLDCIEALLTAAGYGLGDVLRLGIHTTDIDEFVQHWDVVRDRFAPGSVPPNTLLQYARLAHPKSKVEIDATAVR